jgi:hypothetical protein
MKWKVTRFTDDDFANADRIERIYMSIVQPQNFEVNSRDQEYLNILDKAYPIIRAKAEPEALQLIAHLEGGKWRSQIEDIYRDALRLYDNFNISADMLTAIATRQLMMIAQDMSIKYETAENESAQAKMAEVARRSWETILRYNNVGLKGNQGPQMIEPPRIPTFAVHEIYTSAEVIENPE